ncbi:MAG TPA: sigma-E factor negative regulatory protein [Thermodesulfobacteriota bacterium]|nr:sigma-E factor negative regulatory protein [Thermodesulfobacteriota bacterium]
MIGGGKLKEEISAYIDSELIAEETDALVDTLRHEPDARNDWFLYHLTGDAMRGQSTIDDGFSIRIIAELKAVEIDPLYDPLDNLTT